VPRVLIAFEPPDGGVAEHVRQLAGGLGAHGWDVELAGPAETPLYAQVPVPAHPLPLVRGYGTPGRDAAALRGLSRLIRRGGYDLVHAHSAKAGVLARLAARAARVPVVYSPHCFPFVGDFGRPRRWFATATERALAPATAAIVCVCADERRRGLAAGLSGDRLRVVRNACAAPDGAPPDAALAAFAGGAPVAAAISVLRPQKRVDVFLAAVPEVWARFPEARLAVVGDGPLRGELEAQARALGLLGDPRFAFLPFSPPSARHLRAVDVAVLSSSWEALPIAALEALSCGVPQVATAVGGTPEAVTPDVGLLVPPADPGALGAAIARLLADPPARGAMAAAARERWRREFTLDRMLAETAAVYAAVTGG
jgi:glycosyltransferase involved in cell wall biosynthesis